MGGWMDMWVDGWGRGDIKCLIMYFIVLEVPCFSYTLIYICVCKFPPI